MQNKNQDSFFSKYFFYRVPKEEKNAIRQRIMEEDFLSTKIVLICICALQVIMLIRSIIAYGLFAEGKTWIQVYRVLYSILGISCGAALISSKEAYTRKNSLLYFSIMNTMMIIIECWGAGISILDSYASIDLTVMSYVCMVLPIFLIVEPWLSTINIFVVLLLTNLHFALSPSYSSMYSSGVLINSISILALYIIATCFSFYRRIRKQKLEFKINDLNKLLERKAIIDDLTGLYNRHYLSDMMLKPLKIGKKPSALLMLDIDYFKKINDIYGHLAGDQILRILGKIIQDFIGNSDYAIRYGGEEFLLYFDTIDRSTLTKVAEELRKEIEATSVDLGNGTILNFNVSIGGALASASLSYAGLISKADKALYLAKEKRNVSVISE